MKKLGYALLTALVVLSVAACSLESPATGRLTINVPAASAKGSGGGLDADILGSKPGIRIYIKINGTFVKSSSGAEYFASDLHLSSGGDNTIAIDLPPSKGYQVLSSIGNQDNSNGWVTEYYGETESFTVSAGASTAVPLKVALSPFRLSTIPSSSKSFAAYVGGHLWVISNNTVTEQGGSVSASLSGVGTINSLSEGWWFNGPELWINTSSGVWAISETTALTQRISSGNITGSTAFIADIGSGADAKPYSLVAAYYGDDLAVAYSNTTSETMVNTNGNWKIGSLKDYLDSSDGSSLKKLIDDPGKLVRALAFVVNGTKSYGYVATSLGAYYYNSQIQNAIGTSPMNWLKGQLTKSDYMLSTSSGKTITTLALDDATSPTKLYAGTSAGLFATGVDTSVAGSEKPSSNNLTSVIGGAVQALAAGSGGSVAFVNGDGDLQVFSGSTWTTYPFYCFTATPTGAEGLVFYQASGQKLAVASSDGVVTLSF